VVGELAESRAGKGKEKDEKGRRKEDDKPSTHRAPAN
jgi:hypothetical protein